MKVAINTERHIWMINVNIVGYLIPHCLKLIQFLMCMTDITVDVSFSQYGYIVVNFSELL